MKSHFLKRSIARRLQFGVGLAACLVLGLTVWFNYRTGRNELSLEVGRITKIPPGIVDQFLLPERAVVGGVGGPEVIHKKGDATSHRQGLELAGVVARQ